MDKLEDIFNEAPVEPVIDTPFEKFCKLFKENWKLEETKSHTDLKKHKMFYVETYKGIEVYKVSKNTKIAYFYENDSWLDNRELYDLLRFWMPEYQLYFQRKKNLISDCWMR